MSDIDHDACMPWDKCTSSSLLLLLVFLSCLIETIPCNYIIDCRSRIQAMWCVSLAMWVTVPWHVPWRLYTWASVNALLSFSFHLLLTFSLWLLQQMIKTVDFAPETPGPSPLRTWGGETRQFLGPYLPVEKLQWLFLSLYSSLYIEGMAIIHCTWKKRTRWKNKRPCPPLSFLSRWYFSLFSLLSSSLSSALL